MGAGFNITIKNDTLYKLRFESHSSDCMSSNSSTARLFDNTSVDAGKTKGGYCEAKGSGSCAFTQSTYSFDVVLDKGADGSQTIATVSGKPKTGASDSKFAKAKLKDGISDYRISNSTSKGSDGNPSFTFTIETR